LAKIEAEASFPALAVLSAEASGSASGPIEKAEALSFRLTGP
jgi:hypothetical protein